MVDSLNLPKDLYALLVKIDLPSVLPQDHENIDLQGQPNLDAQMGMSK